MENEELRTLQQELEASLARYADLYHNAPVGYLTLTDRGVISDVNLTAASLLGVEPSFLLDKPFTTLVVPEFFNVFREHEARVLSLSGKQSCDLALRRPNAGGHFFGRLESILRSADGRTAIHTVLTDITEHRDMEEKLRRNEERLRLAKKGARLGIFDHDLVTGGLDWDRRVRMIWGVAQDVPVTIDLLLSGIHPDDRPRIGAATESVIKTGQRMADYLEYRVVNIKDHTETWVRAIVTVLWDGGHPVRLIGTVEDVTDRKRMEKELETARNELEQRVRLRTAELHKALDNLSKERQRFYDVLETLPVMICLITPDYHIAFENRAYRERCGPSRGRRCFEHTAGRTQPCDFCEARKPFETGQPHRWECRSADGKSVFDTYDFPFTDVDGSPLILEMNIEISGQRRLEEHLAQAQKMEAIGTLAGGIAHDFNNMLAIIIGNAELALDGGDPDDVQANIVQILNASRRSRDLVKQILTFSRKSEGQRKVVSLAPLIRETAQLLRRSLPSFVDIKVDIRTESDTILGNASQIQQVLMNLSTNAAHAMGENGGTLAFRLSKKAFAEGCPMPERDMQPGEYLKLTVRDAGTGIAPEVRKRMFDPFFTTKEPGEGTGMGLAVVFGIVKSHKGAITVASRVGKGSVFTVFFPSAQGAAEQKVSGVDPLRKGKERILVVDDEASIIEVVSRMLERLGYRTTPALSGPEGWRKFESNPDGFDLVITDHVMPDLTGMKLAEKMLAVRADLPIILCTGYSEAMSQEKARAAGISAFLMKPVTARALAESVRRTLDGRRGQGDAGDGGRKA